MTELIPVARHLISQAIQHREQLHAEIEELDIFIRVAGKLTGGNGSSPPVKPHATNGGELVGEPVPGRRRRRSSAAEAVPKPERERAPQEMGILERTKATAKAILQEVGHPMSTPALVQMIEQRGIYVGGQNPGATLTARLKGGGHQPVVYRKPDGWCLAEDDPAANVNLYENEAVAEAHASP